MLDRDVTVALAKRLLAFHEAGTTEAAADVYRVPTAHYIDADRWQLEMDRIFRRVPLPLALPSGGDRRARRLRRGPSLRLSLPRLGVRPGREPERHVRKGDVRAGR